MAKVSITDAAKLAGIGRQHLYRKYITPREKNGITSPSLITVEIDNNGNKVIDTAEILRVFKVLHTSEGDTTNISTGDNSTHNATAKRDNISTVLNAEVATLRDQLAISQERLKSSLNEIKKLEDDKQWLKAKVDNLTDTLKRIEYKQIKRSDAEQTPITQIVTTNTPQINQTLEIKQNKNNETSIEPKKTGIIARFIYWLNN